MPTIKLPHGSKPSKGCDKHGSRPLLKHGRLFRHEDALWLTTTDSFIAIALRVTGDAEPGVIPYAALKAMERGYTVEQTSPTAWKVARDGYTEVVYDLGDRVDPEKLPKLEKLADGWLLSGEKFAAKTKVKPFAVDPQYLVRVGRALGGPICFEVVDPCEAIHVRALYHEDRRALLMPMQIDRNDKPKRRATVAA